MKLRTTFAVACLTLIGGLTAVNAQNTVYWDKNGTTAGSNPFDNPGNFTDGFWGTDSYWNPLADGTGTPGAWVAGDHAVFSAGNDGVDSFIDITGTQVASSLTIEEGIVFLASGVLDTGAGNIVVKPGATLRIESILRFPSTVTGKVILENGTLWQSNPGFAGSFLRNTQSLEITGTGIIDRTAQNTDNSEPTEPPNRRINIYTPINGNAILGTGGTTDNGGAGTLIKTGPDEFRYQGAGLPLTTFAKLEVNEGLYRLGFSASTQDERGFGAVPLSVLPDAITLNGGSIAHSFNAISLHANRGITIGPNGGAWAGGTVTVPGPLTSSVDLNITGGGMILTNLGNATTFTGKINASGGTIGANVDANLGAAPGSVVADQITLGSATTTGTILGNTTFELNSNRGITLAGNGQLNALQVATVTYNGIIAGTGNLTKTGLGTWVLGGNNTYNGTTTSFGGGVLSISSDANLGVAPVAPLANAVTLAGATTGGTLRATASFSLNANRGVLLNVGQPTVGDSIGGTIDVVANQTFTVPGVVSGDGKLTKTGAGTLVLTNENTNTGLVSVNGGTLLVNNTSGSGTGTGAVDVNTGGTLGGTGSIGGLITAKTGGTVTAGASIGTLIAAGGLTTEAGSILSFELGAPGTSDLINVTLNNGLTLNGGSVSLSDAGGLAAGNYTLIDYAGTLGGSLANLGTPTGPGGFNYALTDTGSTIDLLVTVGSATLIGDYNNDGIVNAADYTVWRDNLGAATLANNRDPANVGNVGQPDYDSWKANFGASAGSGAGVGATVPEPASLVLVGLALAGLLGLARRTR